MPPAYRAEKAVREIPVPARKSSTKTEIRNDWPGAEAAKATVARARTRSWWGRYAVASKAAGSAATRRSGCDGDTVLLGVADQSTTRGSGDRGHPQGWIDPAAYGPQ